MGGGEMAVEHRPDTPLSPCCDPGCSCVCHLQRPGMKLIWVPVDWEDGGRESAGGEEDDLEGEDSEEDVEIEVGGEGDSEADNASVFDDNQQLKSEKTKFFQSLGVVIAESHRRLSDPGPHTALISIVSRCRSPPVPPKRSVSPPVNHQPSEDEEENIYEITLPVAVRKEQLNIPQIIVPKPPRRSKLPYSVSDPTSDFQNVSEPTSSPNAPPAIPPRMPVTPGSRNLPPEDQRSLRSSSPSSPQRALSPPSSSPLQPHRAPPPPPPPKTDPKRLSSASLQSQTQRKGLC